ncbi:hypothetical protein ACFYT4_22215 [Streptomyces sp. NPDC004609]|uniref:hypothetical protein n=1 Tax=Streptomyces sp. NPDC004609 TaxID=3364704 RepID=UPI0036BF7B49
MRLAALVVVSVRDSADPLYLETYLRCPLEAHRTGPHAAPAWRLDDARGGEVWVRWAEGEPPSCALRLAGCAGHHGPTGDREEACTLFDGHPGGHSHQLADPGDAAVQARDEYAELRAVVGDWLRDLGFPHTA